MNALWEQTDPGFLAPVWLAIGLLAVIAVVLLEIGARRRRRNAIRQFAASHLIATLTSGISPVKRLLKAILLVSAVGLLFVAMARPHLFYDWRDENRSGLDLLIAVDCSKSMLTEDVVPNRLERAKLAISDFADRLPDNRLGLIAFAGDAFLQCPMTLDHDAFQTAVRELDTDTIPRPGTDLASAIDTAVDALRSQPNNLKFLILVTDGEDLEGRVLDSAKNAAQSGIKIYTVGVGTAAGGLIPERDDSGAVGYHHDSSGQIVQSKLDEGTLRQIASLTGGAYVPLGQRGEGLDEIYNRYIASLPKQHIEERREKIRFERFEWPLALALIFLAWEFLTTERGRSTPGPVIASASPITARRPSRRRQERAVTTAASVVLFALMLFAAPSSAYAAKSSADKAENAYTKGDYENALENYRRAAEENPDRSDLQYDRGTAAFKAGEFNEAEDSFHQALETPDLDLQEKTYYNLGDTLFQHGQALQKVDSKKTMSLWQQSLHSFDSALKLKQSADAQHNYDIVKRKLEALKKQQQQQQQKNQGDSSDPNKQDQSGSNSQQQDQSQGGQGNQQQQNQSGGQDPNDPNKGQGQQPQGGNPGDQQKPGNPGDGQDKTASSPKNDATTPVKAYSGTREMDKQDPGIKSRQDAENLLDSLKDDERHVTARTVMGDNQPQPTPSGKDW